MSEQGTEERLSKLEKIRSVTVRDFRGLVGEHSFDTDADIVLFAGPNGYGKSSLLEALLLLLTDHQYHPHGTEVHCGAKTLFSSVDGNVRPAFSIQAIVNKEETNFKLTCEREEADSNDQQPVSDQGEITRADWLSGADKMRPDLAARLCAFFQDRVKELFDETTNGTTLRDVLEPIPPEIGWYQSDVSALEKKLNEAKKEISKKPLDDPATISRQFVQSLGHLRGTYEEIRKRRENWPEWPQSTDRDINEKMLSTFAVDVLAAEKLGIEPGHRDIPKRFKEILEQTVGNFVKTAEKQAAVDHTAFSSIEKRIEEINEELNAIAKRFPKLDEDVIFFNAEQSEAPDLLSVFQSLAQNKNRWTRVEIHGNRANDDELRRVVEEVRAVVTSDAWQCARILETWLSPRRDDYRKKSYLQQEKERQERELERARKSEELTVLQGLQERLKAEISDVEAAWEGERQYSAWVEKAPLRDRAYADLTAAADAVLWLSDRLHQASKGSEKLKRLLQELLNAVVHRFNFVEGVYPLEVIDPEEKPDTMASEENRRSYEILTKDKRTLQHLSTGQFAQIAVSLLVAQNQVLRRFIPHRILLLDDVSTAYDLSNLTREAILWRQLAYVAEGDGEPAYQIFISTHHEDLMSHLIDLLVPPKGRAMRIIRFLNWTPETGPVFEQFRVCPSGERPCKANGEEVTEDTMDDLKAVREDLRRAIEETLW